MSKLPKPIKRKITPPEDHFYQAIGLIQGAISYRIEQKDGKDVCLFYLLLDKKYKLFLKNNCQYMQSKLLDFMASQQDPYYLKQTLPVWLKVYPQYHPVRKEYYFRLLYWYPTQPQEPDGFLLKGVWQNVPILKGNYFTIYRNAQAEIKQFFKNSYLPISWDEPAFRPSKKTKIKASFTVIKADFEGGQLVHKATISTHEQLPAKKVKAKRQAVSNSMSSKPKLVSV